MRIGIDIRPLQSTSRDRGIGYYLRGLLAGLAGAGGAHEYILLAIAGRALPPGIGAGLKAEFVTLPLANDTPWRRLGPIRYARWLNPWHVRRRGMRYDNILQRWVDMRLLAATARRARLDVLHLPSVFEPEYFANVGPGFPCPTVQTVYDLIPEIFPEINQAAGWWYWYTREMGRRSLADGPGRLVAISESARRDVERLVPETQGRTAMIFCGVGEHFAPPPPPVMASVPAKYGLRAGCFFLTSGGTEWRKNLPTALAAFARFAWETPGFQVAVPGRLSDEDRVQTARWASAVGLAEDQVVCTGFVADDDLPALYASAAALLFPSRYEGFGLPVVEAMRCGCPVITASNSSLPEVTGDAALLVDDADDAAGLARFMQRVVQEPGLAEDLRERGLAQARRFSWALAARRYLEVYAEAAGVGRQEAPLASRV